MKHDRLTGLGLTREIQGEAALFPELYPARVSEQHHNIYEVMGEQETLQARVSGKLAYNAEDSLDFPVVGDWVMIDRLDNSKGEAIIHRLLPRKSAFGRKSAGTSNEGQIVAANIDTVFICMSLNENFNLRRMERYLSVAWSSMATPVVVLTKADLCDGIELRLAETEEVAMGADILVCSAMAEDGYEELLPYISEGKTIAFVGSSGVGKSTMINRLMGEEILATREIGGADKGRHTTTHRQLLLLPGGGIVIDTPGMRELQIDSADLSRSFEDIEDLAAMCKFSDCSHTKEPGCAVQRAIANGELSQKRFESYKKLQKETGYEGLNSRQLEQEKINRMFGSKREMKQAMKTFKNKNK
ncbi:MAG: ribosome small subunit-dependent GTPase A [Anaerovoracaceae bacterium]